ncbi:MAG: Rid family detoxifying hydrolase [Anaerolineales bacterium]
MNPIHAEHAPQAIGPYSHAIRSGKLLFCSGQTPLDPVTMKLSGETIEDQTTAALTNLSRVLESAGLSLADVVKTTVFLKDMDDFTGMNAAYAAVFGEHKPARTTISVRANPLDALVEIECMAEFPDG